MKNVEFITVDGRKFEIVDYVPQGYEIWNIGKNMPDGYLPLCRLKQIQPFVGGREIEDDTLKAIKTDGAQKILSAIAGGQKTIKSMERYIKRYHNMPPDTLVGVKVQRMKEALPIMRSIKWEMI